jgi:hypothetical protein
MSRPIMTLALAACCGMSLAQATTALASPSHSASELAALPTAGWLVNAGQQLAAFGSASGVLELVK